MAEFGATRIVSAPRVSSTRPLRPVRIESPGLSVAWAVSDAGCTPEVATHTSPVALLTCQSAVAASSARTGAPANSATANASEMKDFKQSHAGTHGTLPLRQLLTAAEQFPPCVAVSI